MLAYNCVLIMSLLWLNCHMTTAFPVTLFGYGDPVISPSGIMWAFGMIYFLFIQTGNCEIAKTKNGEPCVAKYGISAVCDYHGKDYYWCWTSDSWIDPSWDYCNAVDNDGMMVEETKDDQCPEAEGFIRSPSGDQCFTTGDVNYISWEASEAYCRNNSMELAKPLDHNVPWLSKTLEEKYDDLVYADWYWVGARGGSGGVYTWQRDGEVLHNDSPRWGPGEPAVTSPDSSRCVALYAIFQGHDSPLYEYPCSTNVQPLCERLMV